MGIWHARLVAAVFFGAVGLTSASIAQAQVVTIENVAIGSGPISVKIPRVDFDGPSLSRDELAGIFDPNQAGQLADRLRRLSAKSVRMPEILLDQVIGAGPNAKRQTIRYGAFTVTNISGGKAQSMRMEPMNVRIEEGSTVVEMSLGAITSNDMDIGLAASFFSPTPNPDPTKRTAYRNLVMDGLRMNVGNEGTFQIGKVSLGEFKMRPLKTSFATLMQVLNSTQPGAPPSGEAIGMLVKMYADIFDAYETSAGEVAGMSFSFVDKKEGKPAQMSIGRIAVAPFVAGVLQGYTVENFKLAMPDGSVNFGAFGVKAIDLRPFISGVTKMGDAPAMQWLAANWRDVLPNIFGVYLQGFALDVPHKDNPGGRIAASLGLFDIALGKHVFGLPTDLQVGTRDLAVDLTKMNDPQMQALIGLGYSILKGNDAWRLTWDEASKSITLTQQTSIDDFAVLSLQAKLANAPAELFGKDVALMQVAALGLTATEVIVKLENKGGLDRGLQFVGSMQGANPAQLKQQYGAMVVGMLPAVLGNSPQVTAVAQAISKFLQNGKSVTIHAKSKNPNGLGLPDIMSIASPQQVLEKVDLAAAAD